MTLSSARAAAADAIRAKFPETDADGYHLVRVVEVDPITERDIPRLADGLWEATTATEPTARGPAAVAVMARGRAGETQAIELTAYTIIRSRLEIELDDAGRGRGLAMLDEVEAALSALPAGLPDLLCESAAVRLDPRTVELDETIHIYATRCAWPSAFPDTPLDTPIGGAMGAIRDHFAEAVAAALPGVATAQVGKLESDQRAALIRGLVPRAGIVLQTQRETLGGEHDLAVVATTRWTDSAEDEWEARAASQAIVVTMYVWHRDERLADEAVARIMGQIDGSSVRWPGAFDANVLQGSDIVTVRRTDGQYRELVELLNRTPAEWDAEKGLHRGAMQARVMSVTQLAPAARLIGPLTMEKTAMFREPGE